MCAHRGRDKRHQDRRQRSRDERCRARLRRGNDSNLIEIAADIDDDNTLTVSVRDFGRGIEDVAEAREPFFTTKPDAERSGMGFTIIETFMDDLEVESAPGKGTTVIMRKRIGGNVGA